MLLGWHYRWEYANDYGANQYLASRGFIVLSVAYRLSLGYGQAFQFAATPAHAEQLSIATSLSEGVTFKHEPASTPAASASGALHSAAI